MLIEEKFLSNQQISGLKWLREGKNILEIAQIQQIEPEAVIGYLAKARQNLEELWDSDWVFENTLLSPRQIECLQGLKEGLTICNVAEKLKVSPETVKSHLKEIRLRLDSKNNIHSVINALKLGIIKI